MTKLLFLDHWYDTLATAVWQIFQMISLSPHTIQAQPLSFTFTDICSSATDRTQHQNAKKELGAVEGVVVVAACI